MAFVVIVQSLSCVQLFVTPWTVAHQAPLFFTVSWSLLKFMSIESVMLSNHLSLCHLLQSFRLPSIFLSFCLQSFCPIWLKASASFPMSQLFASGGQSIGALVSATVLPMHIQTILFGMKKNKILTHATMWVNLENRMLSEICSAQKVTCFMFLFIGSDQKKQIHRDRKQIDVCHELRGR